MVADHHSRSDIHTGVDGSKSQTGIELRLTDVRGFLTHCTFPGVGDRPRDHRSGADYALASDIGQDDGAIANSTKPSN